MDIDEADISGSKYVNTQVGEVEQPETTYLLHCKILDASPNQQTVVHAVDQCSSNFFHQDPFSTAKFFCDP